MYVNPWLVHNTPCTKISDFGLIHWEEGMNKKLFMEHLTARGNISYIPPETFTQCPDPPGTTFDVYRWLAKVIFENCTVRVTSLSLIQFTIHNSHSVTLLSTVYNLTPSQVTGPYSIYFTCVWLTLSYPLSLKNYVFIEQKQFHFALSFIKMISIDKNGKLGLKFFFLLWSTALELWCGRFWHSRNRMQVRINSLEVHHSFKLNRCIDVSSARSLAKVMQQNILTLNNIWVKLFSSKCFLDYFHNCFCTVKWIYDTFSPMSSGGILLTTFTVLKHEFQILYLYCTWVFPF